MSVIVTSSGNFGPYKSIETLADRLRCDGTDLPFTVIGSYTISADDSLAPPPPIPAPPVPQAVTMRQARLALLQAGLLAQVNTAITNASQAAQIEWEYAQTVDRNSALVQGLMAPLGLTESQMDALFTSAASL